MNRYNPRQRWEKNASSTVAGIDRAILRDLIRVAAISIGHDIKRTAEEVAYYAAEDAAHKKRLNDFSNELTNALDTLEATGTREWIAGRLLKLRCGRGNEITIVSNDYSDMRSFLTNAYLGHNDEIKEQYGEDYTTAETPFQKMLSLTLKTLDKSSDRRENTWDYRDKPLHVLHPSDVKRRRAAFDSDRRFDKMFSDMFGDGYKRRSGMAIAEWKVEQQQSELV